MKRSPLAEYLYREGYTVKAAAEKADIGYAHLTQISNGKLSIGAPTIRKLLDFGVPRNIMDLQLKYIEEKKGA